jgi:hypothetical protein
MLIVKKPFDFKGTIDRGRGLEDYNGVVRRGWKVRLSKRQSEEYTKMRLVYRTKEEKKAYIVHRGGSWFEVRYGTKTERVQGKANAEQLRDSYNAKNA